jgi:hypothetical protein
MIFNKKHTLMSFGLSGFRIIKLGVYLKLLAILIFRRKWI